MAWQKEKEPSFFWLFSVHEGKILKILNVSEPPSLNGCQVRLRGYKHVHAQKVHQMMFQLERFHVSPSPVVARDKWFGPSVVPDCGWSCPFQETKVRIRLHQVSSDVRNVSPACPFGYLLPQMPVGQGSIFHLTCSLVAQWHHLCALGTE